MNFIVRFYIREPNKKMDLLLAAADQGEEMEKKWVCRHSTSPLHHMNTLVHLQRIQLTDHLHINLELPHLERDKNSKKKAINF